MNSIRKHWYYTDPKEGIKSGYCLYFVESYTGYFDLCFHFNNLKIQLFYSTCTNILDDLFKWIKEIDNNNKTIVFIIDEEGPINKITLNRMESDNDNYEIVLSDNGYYFSTTISKEIFLKKLLNALNILINNKTWGKNNSIGEYIKKELKYYFDKYNINEYKECIECREKLCE